MGKVIKLFVLVFILFITGCTDKYITCKIEIYNKDNNYTFIANYKVYYKESYVTKIEKEEIYKSTDVKMIEYFDEYKTLEYDNLNTLYKGYTFNIEKASDTVTIYTVVDMSLVDVKKMVKDNYLNEDYAIGKNLTTSGLKYFYKSKGIKCDI